MLKQRSVFFMLAACASLGLITYAYLGNFMRLMADDFCSFYFAEQLGLLRSIWYWYRTWSGRYTAFAWDWLFFKLGLAPYQLHYIVPVTIILWLLLVVFILYLQLRQKNELAFLHSFTLGGIFLFVVLSLSPNIPQSLFWWNGMRSYALPLVVLTFYGLIFIILKQFSKTSSPIYFFLGFSLFFISGGMGETFAVAQAAFISFLIILRGLRLQDGPDINLLFFCLTGAICSLILIILAPGNEDRQALLPPTPDFIKLMSISIQGYLTFIVGLLFAPAKISGLVGSILIAMWLGRHYKENFVSAKPILIPTYVFGAIVLSFVCFPPGVYGYSAPPPTRTIIIPVFFFMVCILYASFLMGTQQAYSDKTTSVNATMLLLAAALLVGFSTIKTASILFGQRDVYMEFARRWDQVDAEIKEAKSNGDESITIPAMDSWARLDRPTQNPKFWATKCYSDYYGIQVYGPPY